MSWLPVRSDYKMSSIEKEVILIFPKINLGNQKTAIIIDQLLSVVWY